MTRKRWFKPMLKTVPIFFECTCYATPAKAELDWLGNVALLHRGSDGDRRFQNRRLRLVGDQLAQERNQNDQHDTDREAA